MPSTEIPASRAEKCSAVSLFSEVTTTDGR